MASLGELERAVMDQLWASSEPQTVRQVHRTLSARRVLAYTTVMTVLQRLARKGLVRQQRDLRAHRYSPVQGRAHLIANQLFAALSQVDGPTARVAALTEFVNQVDAYEAAALRAALAKRR